MGNQSGAVAAARRHRTRNAAAIINEFVELLALPNVSRNLADVTRVADHIVAMLQSRGVEARSVSRSEAAPVVVGHMETPGATSTIGIYAHYDGQPVDQPDWRVDPFTPTLWSGSLDDDATQLPLPGNDTAIDPEWRLYARSASDDKAPIIAICAALDALRAAAVACSVNVLFLFEGEEEIGSPHLADYLNELSAELSAADVWLICDGPVHQTRAPQIVFGVRGISEMEITAYGPVRPLHSGHYGNWAPNPNMELARLVASMKDETGRVLVPGFYEGTQGVTAGDEAAIAALPDDDAALRRELGLGSSEGESLARQLLLPSLNVRGLSGGAVGAAAANVIPTSATASFDIRLAPGNDPHRIMDRVIEYVRSQGWHVVTEVPSMQIRMSHPRVAWVTGKASYPGVRMDTSSALARALIASAQTAADAPVVAVPTFGGSVPLHHFATILGAPIAITPFANHDNNQHAADENIRLANLWYGIDLMAALMTIQLPPQANPGP